MPHKSGFVNLIGEPNAGKSTLMNALVGEALSIITAKAQTTRHRILGILNGDDYQIIFSDTPGILDPKYPLQTTMLSAVREALEDADILVLVIDASKKSLNLGQLDENIRTLDIPFLIVLNKIDLTDAEKLEKLSDELKSEFPKAYVFPLSALHNFGIDQLKNEILEHLPESPPYFEKDALTDRNLRFFVSEIIREQILEAYQKEIPYAVHVEIESFKEEEKITRISALIYVERKTQKGILIGHQGSRLKAVGTAARKKIEDFLDTRVFLELHVKVDEGWRKKEKRLKAFGYKK